MHLAFLPRNPSGTDQPGSPGGLLRHHEKEFFCNLLTRLRFGPLHVSFLGLPKELGLGDFEGWNQAFFDCVRNQDRIDYYYIPSSYGASHCIPENVDCSLLPRAEEGLPASLDRFHYLVFGLIQGKGLVSSMTMRRVFQQPSGGYI